MSLINDVLTLLEQQGVNMREPELPIWYHKE